MPSVADKVQDALKRGIPHDASFHEFYSGYEKLARMYQGLLDKGVVSKRQSRLPSVSDKTAMPPVLFNRFAKLWQK